MKNIFFKAAFLVVAGAVIIACTNDSSSDVVGSTAVTKSQVIQNYADIAHANYQKAYDDAVALEAAINTFTTTPTDANFTIAKNKWKDARESYGTTEAFRFANGPIDDETNGPEGLLNAWPLDENYIDYVSGGTDGGIIAHADLYPAITKEVLEGLNENGGEKNISTGYHAIEFLLWGQDLTAPAANLPGQRPYTDYVLGGTADHQTRRAEYLKVCADLLTDNLFYMIEQWKVGGAYRTTFLALPVDEAVRNMFLGITTLVSAELPIERMETALGNADQEDEHSCFSDNTHRDIYLNLQGVINVYKGTYGSVDGASLEDLVRQASTTAYNDTAASLTASVTKVNAISIPFDFAISGGEASSEGEKVSEAVTQLLDFGANLIAGAATIGIIINV